MDAKNKCQFCGGQLVIEALGSYGDIHKLRKDGEAYKNRLHRIDYGHADDCMIYCIDCGRQPEKKLEE